LKPIGKHPHDLIPDMLNFKEIDDLPFNEIPMLDLFTSGLPDINGTLSNPVLR